MERDSECGINRPTQAKRKKKKREKGPRDFFVCMVLSREIGLAPQRERASEEGRFSNFFFFFCEKVKRASCVRGHDTSFSFLSSFHSNTHSLFLSFILPSLVLEPLPFPLICLPLGTDHLFSLSFFSTSPYHYLLTALSHPPFLTLLLFFFSEPPFCIYSLFPASLHPHIP